MLPRGFLDRPFAHRGLHDARRHRIENSLSAVRAAVEAGYAIEFDLQQSADGEAMVFHDYTLDRVTHDSGPVRDWTRAELERIALTGSPDTVPALPDVLVEIGGRVPVVIELKDQSGCMGPGPDTLERAVARALQDYSGPVAVMSFNPHQVAALKRLAPGVARGLVTESASHLVGLAPEYRQSLTEIDQFQDCGACFISHNARQLDSAAVRRLKGQGVPILCWTVRSPDAERKALEIADAVTFEGYLPDQSRSRS